MARSFSSCSASAVSSAEKTHAEAANMRAVRTIEKESTAKLLVARM